MSDFDANFTFAKSEKDGECVAVLYQNVPFELENDVTYVFNSTGKDYIYLESTTGRQYIIYDYFGNEIESGAITQGVSKIAVGNCYSIKVL